MSDKNINLIANKLVKAFLKSKIISSIPSRYTKKIAQAQKLRKLCESKIKKPIIGFKAGGTAIPVLKKLKEKEPFYAAVYKHNFLQNKKSDTPINEGDEWNNLLKNRVGILYGRQGTEIKTSVGKINIYLSEESYLVGKHQPIMCKDRSRHK